MRKAQQQHIDDITKRFKYLATAKYLKGAKEHGGNIWEVNNLIDQAIDECIDQFIYLSTLREQIIKSGIQLGEREDLIR
jgi:hypothetical protein